MSAKVTPKPKFKKQGVDFAELEVKDWFIYDEGLFMKTPDGNGNVAQGAIDILDGEYIEDMCGEYVRPVDVEIKWKRKEI